MQCFTCTRTETESQKLMCCTRCKSAAYCSAACQKEDWRAHKKVCKIFNQGIAGQLTHPDHLKKKEEIFDIAASFDGYSPLNLSIWKTFENKQGKSDDVVTREMRKLFLRPELRGAGNEKRRKVMLFDLIPKTLCSPKSIPIEAFRKPSSPFLILLEKVGPNIVSDCHTGETTTPLHWVAESGFNVRSMEIHVVLAQQLIDAGAFVNRKSLTVAYTPLHSACNSRYCINLDLIKLLLDNGADPNAQDSLGHTPLMWTMMTALRAATFLLEYNGPMKVNVNVATHAGGTMLGYVRSQIERQRGLIEQDERLGIETHVRRNRYNLEQMEDLEKLLVEKGAIDGGWDWDAEKCDRKK